MTAARLVQNFRGVRALLALVDASAADAVAGTLKKLGAVVSITSDPTAFSPDTLAGFDVLLLDPTRAFPMAAPGRGWDRRRRCRSSASSGSRRPAG